MIKLITDISLRNSIRSIHAPTTYGANGKEREIFKETATTHDGCQSRRPISMEMFTDLLEAVAKGLKNSTSHLSLETGVSQSGVVKILQKHR